MLRESTAKNNVKQWLQMRVAAAVAHWDLNPKFSDTSRTLSSTAFTCAPNQLPPSMCSKTAKKKNVFHDFTRKHDHSWRTPQRRLSGWNYYAVVSYYHRKSAIFNVSFLDTPFLDPIHVPLLWYQQIHFLHCQGKGQVTCINLPACGKTSDGICSLKGSCIVCFSQDHTAHARQSAVSVSLGGDCREAKQNLFSSGIGQWASPLVCLACSSCIWEKMHPRLWNNGD